MSFVDSFLYFPASMLSANVMFSIFAMATPFLVLCVLAQPRKT